MRQIWIPKPGAPEVLEIREAPDPEPQAGEVRVRVKATGINFADIMARMGTYPDFPGYPGVCGYEFSGTVDAIGDGVDESYMGKEVLGLTRFGGYSDVVCVPTNQAVERPEALSVEEAGGFAVTYLTAYQLMVVMGSLKEGETVLVHSAGGGVGISAIQIAQALGANVVGTASKGKHEFLRSIGVEHLIDYRTEDFVKRTLELTDGKGVELALDAVGGSSFKKSYECLSPTGRLGMFGFSIGATGKKRSIWALLVGIFGMPWFRFNPLNLMNENKGVFGVNLGQMWDESDRIEGWLTHLMEMAQEGHLKPRIDRSFSFEEAADAHHYIQDRKNIGKVILVP
ncbi:MAG: alcohol dehydrogenase [Deltaproteobacteria bacterium]|nr:MAG: alcohol dehydrogenase [Deltaproteobacteria bacterium]